MSANMLPAFHESPAPVALCGFILKVLMQVSFFFVIVAEKECACKSILLLNLLAKTLAAFNDNL